MFKQLKKTLRPIFGFKPILFALIYTVSLLGGFHGLKYIYQQFHYPLFWGTSEIIYSTLSFVCCYLFIAVHQARGGKISQLTFKDEFRILNFAYLGFAAIMFFMSTFYEARIALIAGYLLSLGALRVSLRYLVSVPEPVRSETVEGSKKLIIKGAAHSSENVPGGINRTGKPNDRIRSIEEPAPDDFQRSGKANDYLDARNDDKSRKSSKMSDKRSDRKA